MPVQQVFISYSRKDASFVARLRSNLATLPYQQWQDVHNLLPGQIGNTTSTSQFAPRLWCSWCCRARRIDRHTSTTNGHSQLGAGATIVPILRQRVDVHPRLRTLQIIDFTRRGKNWLRLLDAVDRQFERPGPRIRAAFELEDGVPRRIGREFVTLMSVDGAPRAAKTARFRIHDDTFRVPAWTERNPHEAFDTWTSSYGDVPLSVTIGFGKKDRRRVVAATSLFAALRRTHGLSANASIRRALKYIEEH